MSSEIVESLKGLVNRVPKRWNRALELFLRAARRSRVWIVAAWKPSWSMYISKYLYILWWTSRPQWCHQAINLVQSSHHLRSMFHSLHSTDWPAPNIWFFIVCSSNAEAMSILIPLSPQNNFGLICTPTIMCSFKLVHSFECFCDHFGDQEMLLVMHFDGKSILDRT